MNNAWNAISAVSTLLATVVALWLGLRGVWISHKDAARKIGVWVTQRYDFNVATDSYNRFVQLHVSNEGDEPVFDANVMVFTGLETKEYAVGSLSAPSPIQVLAPRQQLDFDISTGIQAYDDTWKLMAEVDFVDSRGVRWCRDREGRLSKMRGKAKLINRKATVQQDIGELGRRANQFDNNPAWLLNPMAVAQFFLNALGDNRAFSEGKYEPLLATEAEGWESVDWAACRIQWAKLLPTSFVQYPAPRIAQIKLAERKLEGKQVANGSYLLQVKIMTLTLGERGWRIYGIGYPLPPERILLPHISEESQ
jgi:hypothetical protein